jgi:serine/threonine-protein kinase
MATVFLARQLSLDRLVAIKVLPAKFSTNEKFIERFYKEGRAAAQLNHRNIVAAYDVGQAGEHHYFVMEYVDGDTVYDRIVKHKRFSEKDAIRMVRQAAEALKHAHEKGFVHRDIKPKNMMITTEGVVKLADLGLARAVSDKEAAEQEAGRAYGTPYYISPEQIRGEVKIDGRADIYGLGATFYHMVTGKVPFEGKNPSAVMHKHLKQPLVPPDHVNSKLSPETAMVIEMMMAKSRRKRYQSVTDLLVDLELIEKGQKPHFAHVQEDLTGLTELEEAAPSAIVEKPIVQPTRRARPPMENPFFLGAAGVAALSLLINLVLIAVMSSSSAGGGAPPAGSGNAPGAMSSAGSSTTRLVGAWASTELSGAMFLNVKTVQLALFRNGDGSLVRWFERADPHATMFSWSATKDVITLRFAGGTSEYAYTLEGDTLTMDRLGASPAHMVLRKQ